MCDFRSWCGSTWERSSCHLPESHGQEVGHLLILFHFPLPTQKQEVRAISKSDHRQGPTVKYNTTKLVHGHRPICISWLTWEWVDDCETWFMTKEVLALFPFVCATVNELIVSLSAEKDLAVSPCYDQNSSYFPQKKISHQKKEKGLMETKDCAPSSQMESASAASQFGNNNAHRHTFR